MNRKKQSRTKAIVWTIILLILVGGIGAFAFMPKKGNYDEETAQKGNITTYYSFSGVVEAKNRQNVVAENMMQVKDIKVDEGDQVKKDDVLLTTTQEKEVLATIDGEVSNIHTEESAQVMAGTPLIDIVDYNHLQITVNVDEYDLNSIKVGKKVDVNINALNKLISGTVATISKEATNVNGVSYFTATIDLPKDKNIRVGMSAETKIQNENAKDVVTLSMKAIQFDNNNKPYVFIKGDKDKPVKTYIETGVNDGITVEIKKGVSDSDVILVPQTATTTQFGPPRNHQDSSPAKAEGGSK